MRARAATAVADPTRPNVSSPSCFFRRQWNGSWKVSPDARTIYIDVSGTIYRLDLQAPYQVLRDPWATLINSGSSNTICSALDLRLKVSNQAGIQQWPLVKHMTRLSPEEAAELPKELRP